MQLARCFIYYFINYKMVQILYLIFLKFQNFYLQQ